MLKNSVWIRPFELFVFLWVGNTHGVPALLEMLASELERPRTVSTQVAAHLIGTYGLDRLALGSFLAGELAGLEDYEVELILSPLFTPTLNDQAVFAEWLGGNSAPRSEWPGLISQLAARPTRAALATEDGQTHAVTLREVIIERYVHRLRLEANIPDTLLNLLQQFPSASDRPLLTAVARRAIWEKESRREILTRYISKAAADGGYRLEDAVTLLKVMETYQPANAAELGAQIPHWQRVLRQEINDAAGPKPFFNERVEELHGGGRDHRRQESGRIAAWESELACLGRLQKVLAG